MKIIVISSAYPSADNVYGDVFVHTRLKQYRSFADVSVVGYNNFLTTDRDFVYEGIPAMITSSLEKFYQHIRNVDADLIIGHFIQDVYIDFLISLKKPMIIFVHGFEVLSWRRRMMNYTKLGDFRYLIPYIFSNRRQLNKMRALMDHAAKNQNVPIHFVFVSNWLKTTVEQDFGLKVPFSHVIPNGIDTSLFSFREKTGEHRKRILLLRSFKAHNYANDISVDAILQLSKKPFFSELQFTICGEGYLFSRLTEPLKQFPNVTLQNYFIENKNIASLHSGYGIFLCPSRLDTQGVSMCEAMSSGLVPITSPIGGIPEYATDGVSSFQSLDATGVAEKIEYLFYHPEVFLQMSSAARAAIEAKCTITQTIQQEMALIQSMQQERNPGTTYQQCTHCVLDTNDDPKLTFDEQGVCSYCNMYRLKEPDVVKKGAAAKEELAKIVLAIKEAGKGKPYDCILGLSGGLDSSYVALQAHKLGLRPLAVHFDNGWNSELSVKNIQNIIQKLNIPLYTLVVDWEEFRDLQVAFLKASVVDIEMVTDHAIIATLYRLAIKHNIKYILSGTNFVTEAILPPNWIHRKADYVHINALNTKFGGKPLETYPLLDLKTRLRADFMKIKSVSILNCLQYNKEDAREQLIETLGWRNYGGKHHESVFTRFYQEYILPRKFKVDKRKAHLSNLICSGQITREQAFKELEKKADEALLKSDYEFVTKKLNLTTEEFEKIMHTPPIPHDHYPIEKEIYDRKPYLKVIRPLWQWFKRTVSS